MKADTHPRYQRNNVTCSCGNKFTTGSTAERDLRVETCSNCHPVYTGKQKVLDSVGQIHKFQSRYQRS